MKIVLYGTCSFPFFFRELIRMAQEKKAPVEWRALVLSWRHMALYKDVLAPENLLYVHPRLNELMEGPAPDLSVLSGYPGSIFSDISADKNVPGQLRRRPKEYQLKNALAYHRIYEDYLLKEKPDAVFLPMVETHDGMILYKTAVKLGIKTVFTCHSRNIGLSFLSRTPFEELPLDDREPIPAGLVEKAELYIDEFKKKPQIAFSLPHEPLAESVLPRVAGASFADKLRRFPRALWGLLKDQWLEPHAARPNPLWFQPIIQFWKFNRWRWRLLGKTRRRYFDVLSVSQLPKRFIYFPLHFQPELTITTYAPYFEDQLRAIDMILLHMPSDCQLVVKEHPVMRGQRPARFYRLLRRKAGLLLADCDVPGIELIRRSLLTAAVTGTAALEALLLGKPSFVFGRNFFSPWTDRFDSFAGLGQALRDALQRTPEELRKRAVDLVTRVSMTGRDYFLFDPYDPTLEWKHTMNRDNVARFLEAFMDHVHRETRR
jgi:hypothetical protein